MTKLEKKNVIIEKSINIMYLYGYNGTSVNDIVKAAGIPKGSFYNYFINKEEYAVSALTYYRDFMRSERISILDNSQLSPLERIITFFTHGISSFEEKELKYGCLAGNLSQEMGDINDDIAQAANDFHKLIVSKIQRSLDLAKKSGIIKSSLDSKMLSSFIVSSWQGALLRVKTSGDHSILDDFLIILNTVLLN